MEEKGNRLYLNKMDHKKKKDTRRQKMKSRRDYREEFDSEEGSRSRSLIENSIDTELRNSMNGKVPLNQGKVAQTVGRSTPSKNQISYAEVVNEEDEEYSGSSKKMGSKELKDVYAGSRQGNNTNIEEIGSNQVENVKEVGEVSGITNQHEKMEELEEDEDEVPGTNREANYEAGDEFKKRLRDRFKHFELINPDEKINIQEILVENVKNGETSFYCVCLLSAIEDRYVLPRNVERLCKTAMVLVRDEEGLTRSRQPLICCALLAELLYRLAKTHVKFQYKCFSVANYILEVAESIQNSIKDEETLNYYIRVQQDHTGRSCLEIVSQNRFFSLLSDDNVGSIVTKMWYGDGQTLGLTRFSHMQKFAFANLRQGTFEFIKDEMDRERSKSFSFQYHSFISNCSVRFLVDSISTILATFLYQALIYFFVAIHKHGKIDLFSTTDVYFNLDPDDPETVIPENTFEIKYDPFENDTFKFTSFLASIVAFSITCNFLFSIYFALKTNIKIKMNAWIFIDVFMFIAVLFNFLEIPKKMTDELEDQKMIFAINYSIIIVLAWARVVAIIMRTKTFGPFLRIVYMLTGLIFNFIIIYFCINMMFAEFFTVFFYKVIKEFESIWPSWQTLFKATFAVYDFELFDDNHPLLGSFFLVSYITITNVMLLNLIIAIINNQYVIHSRTADAENRAILVMAYEKIKWNKEWGLLILLPAPLNLISMPFVLIHSIFVPDSKREQVNQAFCKICYISIALFYFLYLLVSSILLYPFALLRSYAHSIYDNYKHKNESVNLLSVFLLRPFVFLGYIVKDLADFWNMAYKPKVNNARVERRQQKIELEMIYHLRMFLTEFKIKYKKKIVSAEEIYKRMNIKDVLTKKKSGTSYSKGIDDSGIPNSSSATTLLTSPRKSNESFIFRGLEDKDKRKKARAYKYLIEKLSDKDKYVDIDRTLVLLPEKARFSDDYFHWLRVLNMRNILRGLRNHFFNNTVYNPIFFYKKLNQLLSKLTVKMVMVADKLPQKVTTNLHDKLEDINKEYREKVNKGIDVEEDWNDEDMEEENEDEIKQYSKNNFSQRSNADRSYSRLADDMAD